MLHRRRALPEHGQVEQLQRRLDEVALQLVQSATEVSDLELAQRKAEADLEPVRQRRTRDQQRIDTGAVSDPKSLSAMISEVEQLTRRISNLEDAELEVMEALEQAQQTQAARQTEHSSAQDELAAAIRRRDEQLAEIDVAGRELKTERSAQVALIAPELVAYYEKLRATRSGVGAAELKQRRCGGCRIDINAADLATYQAAAPEMVLRCEECGRILVRTDDSGL